MPTPSAGCRVELRRINKRFGATRALHDVSVVVEAGSIHALVGENGAGKSTLGKIIGGLYRQSAGTLLVDDAEVGRWDPTSALSSGIATIQQELSLVPAMSVAENVFLGIETARFGVLTASVQERYSRLDADVGFGIPGSRLVKDLRLADQQKVEILRALARKARLIVLDEPTSSLTRDESDRLHDVMRSLREEGRTLIYVSHFLEHVLSVADRVTIMRDGQVVRTTAAADETKDSLVEGMLGQSMETTFPELPDVADSAPVVYRTVELTGELPQDVSLEVRTGEILGIAGLVGSGRTELARLIAGVDPILSGTCHLDGEQLANLSPRAAIDRGIVMLPEDRRSLGLVLTQNTRENVTLPTVRSFRRGGWLRLARERATVADAVERLSIVPTTPDGEVRFYSGGNQQKALFAKWTIDTPRLIVLDEPTRGVDIGAKKGIYDAIVDLAALGTSVILISSELEEVMFMSHRVLLLSEGRVIEEVNPGQTTVDDVLAKLFGTIAVKERP